VRLVPIVATLMVVAVAVVAPATSSAVLVVEWLTARMT